MPIPSQETIAKIRQLEQYILAEPKRFNLGLWGVHANPKDYEHIEHQADTYNQKGSLVDYEAMEELLNSRPPCGSMACLAGNTCIIAGLIKPVIQEGFVYEFPSNTPYLAEKWLGITEREAGDLFFLRSWGHAVEDKVKEQVVKVGWPEEFENRLALCQFGSEAYAQVAVDRLEHFIATGE